MADHKLEIILSAKDAAGKAFADVQGHIGGLTKNVFNLKNAFAAIAGAVSLGAVVNELNKTAAAASDLQETSSKVFTLFGSAESKRIDEWSKSAATSMGLSRQAALDSLGSMGNMFLQLGAGIDQASGLSTSMVKLSADIASFHNVAGGANEVLEAMQAAFRGEYDSLQKFIPTINAAAVQQQAFADTGKTNEKQLTNLEKATAAYTIIMRDAGAAVGDFERTNAGLANQQRILDAQISDLRANLGQGLLPAYTQIVTQANEWINTNQELINQNLSGWIEDRGSALTSAATAGLKLIEILGKIAHVSTVTRENLMGRAVDYALKGLLDMEQVLNASHDKLKEMVETLDKAVRITEEGEVRYKIGTQTPGYPQPKDSGGAGKGSGAGVGGAGSSSGASLGGGLGTDSSSTDKDWDKYYQDEIQKANEYDACLISANEETNNALLDQIRARTEEEDQLWEEVRAQNIADATAYDEALIAGNEATSAALSEQSEKTNSIMSAAYGSFANQVAGTFADMAMGAETSFEDILKNFTHMILQMIIMKMMLSAVGGGLGAMVFHSGGTVGGGGVTRNVSPGVFAFAPRLHNGLAPDEFPAILQRGERVMSKNEVANSYKKEGGRDVQVIINEAPPGTTATRQQTGPSLEKIIIDVSTKSIASGDMDKMLRSTYGLRRVTATR